jgi:hypothetical protein
MIILPPARRAYLMSFWLVISLTGGLLIGALSSLLVAPRPFTFGVVLALVLSLPGLLRPQVVSLPYRVWNRLARGFAHCARLFLMSVCFYVIFVAVGRTGSALRLTRPSSTQSLWEPRGTLAPAAYISQGAVSMKESSGKSWMPTFFSWAVHSGNFWACCLFPFLLLLSILEPDEDRDFPAGIYTLF